MTSSLVAALLAAAGLLVLLTITPGPDMAYVARVAVARGRRAAIVASVGVCAGLLVHGALASAGLAVLLRDARVAAGVGIAGGAYLAWLGLSGLRAARPQASVDESEPTVAKGFLSNVLNPKVALFYLSVLPAVFGAGGAPWWAPLALSLFHAVVTLVWLAAYGAALASRRVRSSTWGARVPALASVALVAFGAWAIVLSGLRLA